MKQNERVQLDDESSDEDPGNSHKACLLSCIVFMFHCRPQHPCN